MSVLEQYRYEGGIRPDFQELPTQVTPDEELIIGKAAEAEAEAAAEKPAEAEAEAAAEKPAEAEAEAAAEKPAEAAAEKPAEAEAEAAAEKPAEAKAEAAADKPAEAETEPAADKTSKKPEDPVRAFLKEKAGANLVEISRLQKALHSAKKSALIIILHGMPYSGRTETSQFLKKGMKKGVKVYSYKKGEHSHDFLWQMHRRTPKYGNICIMNNSVYADVPNEEGGAEKVRAFEKYLRDSGIAVVRIFLNVSPKKQKNRMLEVITTKPGGAPREVPQDKGWRKAFLEQFADVVEAATPETAWYIIPADNKWYARCLVTEIVRDALRECVRVKEDSAPEAEKAAEAAPAPAAEKAVEPAAEKAPEPAKKPARRTRRKKAETPAEDVKADTKAEAKADTKAEAKADTKAEAKTDTNVEAASDTKAAEAAPAKKTTTRRPRRQGPPKTVEETLARRRKRLEDSEG